MKLGKARRGHPGCSSCSTNQLTSPCRGLEGASRKSSNLSRHFRNNAICLRSLDAREMREHRDRGQDSKFLSPPFWSCLTPASNSNMPTCAPSRRPQGCRPLLQSRWVPRIAAMLSASPVHARRHSSRHWPLTSGYHSPHLTSLLYVLHLLHFQTSYISSARTATLDRPTRRSRWYLAMRKPPATVNS